MIESREDYNSQYKYSVDNPKEYWQEYSKNFVWKNSPSNK